MVTTTLNLAQMRDLVEADLHDATNALWSTDEVDRGIIRALQQFSHAIPVEATEVESSLTGRDIDISGLSDRVILQAVEYPDGNYPKSFVRFSLWAEILSLDVTTEPAATDDAVIYYGKMHSLITETAWVANTAYALGDYVEPTTPNGYRYVCTTAGTSHVTDEPTWPTTGTVADGTVVWTTDAVTSTIPQVHEPLVELGAVGHCLIQWAAEGINRTNVGGTDVAAQYNRQGLERLREFRDTLKELGRQNKVRVRQLYTPYHPIVSKNTVVGP